MSRGKKGTGGTVVCCDLYCAYKRGYVTGKDDWEERRDIARGRRIIELKSRDYTFLWELSEGRKSLAVIRFKDKDLVNPETGMRKIPVDWGGYYNSWKPYRVKFHPLTFALFKDLRIKFLRCQRCGARKFMGVKFHPKHCWVNGRCEYHEWRIESYRDTLKWVLENAD